MKKSSEQRRKIIEFRNKLGLNLSELSNKLGLDSSMFSGYELGRREPTLASWLRMKENAERNHLDLDESLFYQKKKKEEEKEVTFTTQSLLKLRLHLGLSQGEIAELCNITYRTWGRYERGESELLASTYFKIRDVARQRGVELKTPIILEEKEEKIVKEKKVRVRNEGRIVDLYETPSLQLFLQR